MAALGWPRLAVGGDIDHAGLRRRPPDGEDVLDGNFRVQDIGEGGHGGGRDLVVLQEALKGVFQAVGEVEQGDERVEVGWMSHHPPSHQPWLALAINNKHCLNQGGSQWWPRSLGNGGQDYRSTMANASS